MKLDFLKELLNFKLFEVDLFKIYQEISNEVQSFQAKHDFSVYTPNVGVFGENSTGKSTFLNAMLGNKEQFRMGFGETTNKITVLYKKKIPKRRGNFSRLSVAKECKRMDYKHLDYMNLYDIPGFGQQFPEDDLRIVIREMDVVFWFIDASKGIKKEDKLFLESIKGLNTKIIVILNKIDAISDNGDIGRLMDEINNEIKKIHTFFAQENLEKNLITVFPFSATKSLVGNIKGEEGGFKVIDNIVQNVLLYTVFIESYRGYVASITIENIEATKIKDNIYEIIFNASANLEYQLKGEISMLSSINPFSSKNEEAEPIVLRALIGLNNDIGKYIEAFLLELNKNIENILNNLSSFDIFTKNSKLQFQIEPIAFIQIDIDLHSMAWDNFWGDSFAEEVAKYFRNRFKQHIDSEIIAMTKQHEDNMERFLALIKIDANIFATKLDSKISQTSRKIQKPLLELLLRAISEHRRTVTK